METEQSWLKMIREAFGFALLGCVLMRLLFGEHTTDALQVFGAGFAVFLAYGPFYWLISTPFDAEARPKT